MWTHKNTFAIGGLENVGYASGQDNLIVLSAQGQGIFDCISGEKIARLHNGTDWWQSFNQDRNSIAGFGVLESTDILTCGFYGEDHLPKTTNDGWRLMLSPPEPDDKPFDKYLVQKIYLLSPTDEQNILVSKEGPCELRAFGFSDTGKSFIVALSCELTIYSRR
ncbi:MAG: hypothetical protein ACJ75B_09605 [Flavisolibacter sp.]